MVVAIEAAAVVLAEADVKAGVGAVVVKAGSEAVAAKAASGTRDHAGITEAAGERIPIAAGAVTAGD